MSVNIRGSIGDVVGRKTARKILPVILFMYFICYLDRVNISYAALQMNALFRLCSDGLFITA